MKKLFIFLLVLYPILSGYGFSPSLDFGVLLVFFLGIIQIMLNPRKFKLQFLPGYKLFLVVALLLSLVVANTIPIRLILYSINLCIACSFLNFALLKKYYNKVALFCCLFFLFQVVVFKVFNVYVSGLFPLIPTIYDNMGVDLIAIQQAEERWASLFTEPSYLAQYLFPILVIDLFSRNKKDFIYAIIFIFVLLLLGSGNGAILLCIILGGWFFFGNIDIRFKLGACVLLLVVFLFIIFDFEDMFETLLKRAEELQSVEGNREKQSSGFIRFFRGYYAYADMPTINKMLGANPREVKSVVESSYYFLFSEDEFYNGTQTLLLHHGLFSCILFFRHLLLMCWGKHSKELNIMVICCIWLMLGESYFLSARLFLTTCFMYAMIMENKPPKLYYSYQEGRNI